MWWVQKNRHKIALLLLPFKMLNLKGYIWLCVMMVYYSKIGQNILIPILVQSGPIWYNQVFFGTARSSLVQSGPIWYSQYSEVLLVQSGPIWYSQIFLVPPDTVWYSHIWFGPVSPNLGQSLFLFCYDSQDSFGTKRNYLVKQVVFGKLRSHMVVKSCLVHSSPIWL